MKVLFVTTNHFPFDGTCSNILNILLSQKVFSDDKNLEISVLASKEKYDEPYFETINKIGIYRVLSWTLLNRNNFISTLKNNPIKGVNGLASRLLLHFDIKYNKKHYYDKNTYKVYKNEIKKIDKDNKFDVIVSISGRYDATFAVSDYLEKNSRRFVFYQVDPLETNKSFKRDSLFERQQRELQIHRISRKVLTTPIILKEKQGNKNYSSRDLDKILSIEFPLVSPKMTQDLSEARDNDCKNNPIVCMFLGTIYGGVRDPKYTLRLFKEVVGEDVELHLVGVNENDIPSAYGGPAIKCFGRQSIEVCTRMVENADFLVNIGNTVENQVPSKIFDYISSGKPIINICKSNNCPSLNYLVKYPDVLNIVEDEDRFFEHVKQLCEYINRYHSRIPKDVIMKLFGNCTPEYCSRIVYETLYEI